MLTHCNENILIEVGFFKLKAAWKG